MAYHTPACVSIAHLFAALLEYGLSSWILFRKADP
jgi:hypothetical protein